MDEEIVRPSGQLGVQPLPRGGDPYLRKRLDMDETMEISQREMSLTTASRFQGRNDGTELSGAEDCRRHERNKGRRRHLGVLFKHFLFCVIISMKETFKNIFSWG